MPELFVNHTGDNTDGLSEATAFNDIQTAINNAASDYIIWGKIDGTYYTNAVTITFPISASYSNEEWIRIEGYVDAPGDCRRGHVHYGQRLLVDGGGVNNLFVLDRSNLLLANICGSNCTTAYYIGYNSYTYAITVQNCATLGSVSWAFQGGSSYYNNGLWVEDGYYQSGAKFYAKYTILKDVIFHASKSYDLVWLTCGDAYNCAFINNYGGTGPQSPGYRYGLYANHGFVTVRNCYLEGSGGINNAYLTYLIEYNNIFNCYHTVSPYYNNGNILISDFSATNRPSWSASGVLTDGNGRLSGINLMDEYEDLASYDFTLKPKSILRTAGWGGLSGLDVENMRSKTQYSDYIGPCGISIKKEPEHIFTQGG